MAADANDIRVDEDRRRFFQAIGLESTSCRIRTLDRQASCLRANLRGRPPAWSGGHSRTPATLALPAAVPAALGNASGQAPGGGGVGTGGVSPGVANIRGSADRRPSTGPGPHDVPFDTELPAPSRPDGSPAAGDPRRGKSSREAAALVVAPDAPQPEEMEACRRELRERVRKFREEVVEDWRQHEVTLRPVEESALHAASPRRRTHHRVVVQRDEREIQGMPKICVNDGLKRALGKMRENLFQRRLNMAIFEKTINDWSQPQLRSELRRTGRLHSASQVKAASANIGGTQGASERVEASASSASGAGGAGAQGGHTEIAEEEEEEAAATDAALAASGHGGHGGAEDRHGQAGAKEGETKSERRGGRTAQRRTRLLEDLHAQALLVCTLHKLDGDWANRSKLWGDKSNWRGREVWITRQGALCYFSQKEQRAIACFGSKAVRTMAVQRLPQGATCFPFAISVGPKAKGVQPKVFACEDGRAIEAFLSTACGEV